MRRHPAAIESAYLRFISRTRLGVLIAACAVAFFVIFLSGSLDGFASAYTLALFLPLTAVAVWHRSDFMPLLPGNRSWRRAVLLGVVPAGAFIATLCGLVYALHLSFHAPITHYVAPLVEGFSSSQNWVVFAAPFVEEIIFRLWLQTRLQQYFGIVGAVVTALIFLAIHLTISPWRIILAVILTALRYRYGSLGACIIAHYTYDLGLWAFVSFVH